MTCERFRPFDVYGKKPLNITYKDGSGTKSVWSCNQEVLLEKVLETTKKYQEIDIKLTNRQLYYQLVAMDFIPNAIEIYKRICTFATDCRYGGFMDWDALEDRGRISSKPSEWDNISGIIKTAIRAYRLPRWQDQDCYVEMFCEKQALESVLKPIAEKWHVRFGYNKGYSSAASMYELAKRIEKAIDDDQYAVILYFGDHDASGVDMVRDIKDRITEFLTKGKAPYNKEYISDMLIVDPLALSMDQITEYNPPPNPAKITDPRAKKYIQQFGNVQWELDAIEPTIMQNIAEEGIIAYLERDKYERMVQREESDKRALIEFGESFAA